MPSTSDENIHLHKETFNKFVQTLNKNSKVIGKDDLDEIKTFLIKNQMGEKCTITERLRKRIRRHKFVLVEFPSAEHAVCVRRNDKKVS